MSAYLTDMEKIATLASYAKPACEYGATYGNILTSSAERIAEVLALENIRSIRARYHRAERPYKLDDDCEYFEGMTYGDYIEQCKDIVNENATEFVDAEIMAILREYDYQSCETDDYHESLAYTILCQVVWKLARNAHPIR